MQSSSNKNEITQKRTCSQYKTNIDHPFQANKKEIHMICCNQGNPSWLCPFNGDYQQCELIQLMEGIKWIK
jgi:hypothetical protein